MPYETKEDLDLNFPCVLARFLASKSAGYSRVDKWWNFGSLHTKHLLEIQKELIADKLTELMEQKKKDIEALKEQHEITKKRAISEAVDKEVKRALDAHKASTAAQRGLLYG